MSAIAFFGTLELGLLLSLVAMAVYISFRVLDFPDLTVDGSFAFGAAVAARLISDAAPPFNNPYVATLAAAAAGVLAGLVTGFLHVRLRMMHLLAGFLVMVALYSVNLRVMGRPNLPLFDSHTIISDVEATGLPPMLLRPALFLLLAVLAKGLLDAFMRTEFGLALRATGENPVMARANGVRTGGMVIAGIALSNGIVGMTGALFAQVQGVADVSMGVGTIIAGLASLIVGETLLPAMTVGAATLACIAGSVIYRFAVGLALNAGFLGLQAQDLNLATAVLVIAAVLLSRARRPAWLRGAGPRLPLAWRRPTRNLP